MPKISRVRIANILYDEKYIMDEIYDSYDGENMLINLKNGSGKSVLVQLMLQPINPCSLLHGRTMESYLDLKRPSFIIIEWKLDNTPVPTYFLTGIVMVRSAPNERDISRIKYFTFINRYTEACEFDISHIPFIIHDGRGISFEPYAKCRDIIKENVRAGSDFDYFSIENKDRYKDKLTYNGIYCNEWKTIADCNENEGGISDLFNKVETSDKLFDDWILRTIVNNTQLGNNLHEMFAILIDDINNNEDIIRQNETFEKFLKDVDGYVDRLKELMNNFDKIEHQQKSIADIYYFLINRENAANVNISDCEDALKLNAEQMKRLEYEKLSDDYHTALEQLNEAHDNASEATSEKEIALDECTNAKKQVLILKAARLYSEYKKAKAYADAKRTELSALDKGVNTTRYNNLVYSLVDNYSARLKSTTQQLNSTNENISSISEEIKALTDEKEQLRINISKLSEEKGRLDYEISDFTEYEKKVFDSLNISLIRNLTGEYDNEVIDNTRKGFDTIVNELNSHLENNKKQIEQLREKMDNLKLEETELNRKNGELIAQTTTIKNNIDTYKTAESKALNALHTFDLKDSDLFNTETNLIQIEIKESRLKKKIEDYRKEYNNQSDYRNSILRGAVHISPEFTEILKANNIDFEIGEAYLEKENEERCEQLLYSNPMLPFCYIVSGKDYNIIKELTFSESINKVIPIITYDDIQRTNSPKAKISEFDNKNMFICLYNENCIDEDKKKKYINDLDAEIEKLRRNYTDLEKDSNNLIKSKTDIHSFDYDRSYFSEKSKELEALNHSLEHNKNRVLEINSEDKSAENSISDLRLNSNKIEEEIQINNQNKDLFTEYIRKNTVFIANKNKLSEVNSGINENNAKNAVIDKSIADLREDKAHDEGLIRQLNENKTQINSKLSPLDKTVSGELVDISVEQMEFELENILNKRKDSIDVIKRAISENDEKANKASNDLKRLNVAEEDYSNPNIILNDDLLYAAEDNEKNKEAILSNSDEKERNLLVEEASCRGKFNAEEKTLTDAGYSVPLEYREIKRNYSERKKILTDKKREVTERKRNNEQLSKLCRDKYNQLKGCFGQLGRSNTFTTDNIEAINPAELKKALSELTKDNEKIYKTLSNTYNAVRTDYSDCEYTVLKDFIANMNPENASSFENSFAVFERVENCRDCLNSELAIAKNTLENIENEKLIFVHQAVEQGKKIYNEARDISNLSKINLDGKLRQMLSIGIPDKFDAECENNMKLKLDKFLTELRNMDMSDNKSKQKMRQSIERFFSNRELLNIIIGQRNIPVSLYKVDATSGSGGLRTWEDVRIENSGAQLFISTFAFISTIIDYERKKTTEMSGGVNGVCSKTFIIDNPFGTTSSKPFLDAMISVAEKFKVQLICLSDLSQSSITNKFNVIHQLALKTPMYGNKAYLKIDNTVTNNNVHKYSKLEHISLKMEQTSLF